MGSMTSSNRAERDPVAQAPSNDGRRSYGQASIQTNNNGHSA